jgi:probable HAF family extracellular repeat protein
MRTNVLLATLSCGGLCAQAWDLRYTVVPLETERPPWVSFTTATDISDAGWVTGLIYPKEGSPSGGYITLFSYSPATGFVDLGNLPGTSVGGYGINDLGQIAGTARLGGGLNLAFRYTPGVGYELLGSLPGSTDTGANKINARGQVVGYSDLPDGSRHGYRYTDGVGMQDLGHLGGDYTNGAGHQPGGVGGWQFHAGGGGLAGVSVEGRSGHD